jgi:hypothetical protein
MKIALIAAGQPRFTPDFITFMHQLKGFDQADLYFTFWTSEWADSEKTARLKVEKILPPNYNLAKIMICEQPPYHMPPCELRHPPAEPENIRWHYERRIGMWQSLKLAHALIDQEYDQVIKFRLDGRLFENLDLSKLDLTNNKILFPDHGRAGFDNYKVSDLFAVGTQDAMNVYCNVIEEYIDLVPLADPNWEHIGHGTWSNEHVFGLYLQRHNIPLVIGDFKFHINWNGRSKYTDKHYHHQIVTDPTE